MKVSRISKKHLTIKWSDIKKNSKFDYGEIHYLWSLSNVLYFQIKTQSLSSQQYTISTSFYSLIKPRVYLSLCSINVLLLISIRYFLFFSGLSISSTRQPSFPFLSFSFPNAETDWQAWCERTKLFVVQHFIRQRSEDYGPSSREH